MAEGWTDESVDVLRQAAKAFGKQEELAEATGIPLATLQRILGGKSDPGIERLLRLTSVMKVPLSAVLGQSVVGVLAEPAENTHVPIVADVVASAGSGAIAPDIEKTGETLPFDTKWLKQKFGQIDGLRVIKVRGRSMEPTISDDDWVMLNLHDREKRDGIFVVRIEEALMVKHLQFQPSRIMVMSQHPGYESYTVDFRDRADDPDFALIGRAVWAGKSL